MSSTDNECPRIKYFSDAYLHQDAAEESGSIPDVETNVSRRFLDKEAEEHLKQFSEEVRAFTQEFTTNKEANAYLQSHYRLDNILGLLNDMKDKIDGGTGR